MTSDPRARRPHARMVLALALSCVAVGACAGAPDERGGSGAAGLDGASGAPDVVQRLQQAAAQRPLSARAHGHLGLALLDAGKPGRALAHLVTARFLLDDPPREVAEDPGRADLERRVAFDLARARAEAPSPPAAARARGSGHTSRETEAQRTARRTRRRLDEARTAFTESRYRDALAIYEELGEVLGAERGRLMAACYVRLAIEAAREGRLGEATHHLYDAADLDTRARSDEVYRDVARLERRRGLLAAAADDLASATDAWRKAFVAQPDDPETLFLLARAPTEGPGAIGAGERGWFRGVLMRRHPASPEAAFLVASDRVRDAPSLEGCQEALLRFSAAHPDARGLAAELRGLVSERQRGVLAREADQARERYQRMLAEAKEARLSLEAGMEPPPVVPPLPADDAEGSDPGE